MTSSLFTVVNPAAGGGRCGKRAPAALDALRREGLELEVHHTREAGEATELVRKAWTDGWRRFLGVGGDGTNCEIINGLFPIEGDERPTLGLLPLGTGNSFLRDFGLTDPNTALLAIARGDTQRCDVVKATHAGGTLHYINLLSIGFTAQAGSLTNRRFKPLGAVGYVAAVLITAARLELPVFPFRIDDGDLDERPCVLVSFSNSRYTAGAMMMAPHADTTDGALDVIRIGEMSKLAFVRRFPGFFAGRHVDLPVVEESRAKRIELCLPGPIDVMVDGEVQHLLLQSIEVIPGALELIA